jgi:hypothetical protein
LLNFVDQGSVNTIFLEFELRASCLLGRSSIVEHNSRIYSLVIFEIESYFLPRPDWTMILLFQAYAVAGTTNIHHHRQPLIEIESQEFFAQAGLKP